MIGRWGVLGVVALLSGAQLAGCDGGADVGPAVNAGAGGAAGTGVAGYAGGNAVAVGGAGGTSGSTSLSAGAGGDVQGNAGSGGSAAGSGGAGGFGMIDGGVMNGERHCPEGLPGPTLVEVPAPAGSLVASYCMDATEVSAAHYGEFLAAAVPATGQPLRCSWNTSFDDEATPIPSDDGGLIVDTQPTPVGDMPMRNVDWCDAYAYCDWAGKRLCGGLAGSGVSEWQHACSAGSNQRFPYGDTYEPLACNGLDNTGSGYVPVGSMPECEGGYPGLFDLSGNVWEWQFPCSGSGADAFCEHRGGSYRSHFTSNFDNQLSCTRDIDQSITHRGEVGIRCCADTAQ